jgi:DNA-binding GntR family transcriptional regulator
MLQRDRLIEGEYNRRVRIAPLTSGHLEQVYALRIVQEAVAIRVSVSRLTEPQFYRLGWLLGAMQEHAEPDQFPLRQEYHREFHAILVSHAGALIIATVRELADHCQRHRFALVQQRPATTIAVAAQEHAAIVEACRRRDRDLAAELLARHLTRAALSLSSISDPAHDPVAVREALRIVIGSQQTG